MSTLFNKKALRDLIADEVAKTEFDFDFSKEQKEIEASITAKVNELVKGIRPTTTEIVIVPPKAPKVKLGVQHEIFPTVLDYVRCGESVYLVGPAGSGKTTLAKNVAKALGLKFHFCGAIKSEFKLIGFTDAQGRTIRTPFREAFEKGGLFLFDEVDGSYPEAVLAFNAALANGECDFPDGCVTMHEDFRVIAAANTFGLGADRQYVGRTQLDAATLDRFAFIEMGYDESLETALAGNADWSGYVQRVRKSVETLKLRHIVSPRASIKGAKLLANGVNREAVERSVIWKSLDAATVAKVKAGIN